MSTTRVHRTDNTGRFDVFDPEPATPPKVPQPKSDADDMAERIRAVEKIQAEIKARNDATIAANNAAAKADDWASQQIPHNLPSVPTNYGLPYNPGGLNQSHGQSFADYQAELESQSENAELGGAPKGAMVSTKEELRMPYYPGIEFVGGPGPGAMIAPNWREKASQTNPSPLPSAFKNPNGPRTPPSGKLPKPPFLVE